MARVVADCSEDHEAARHFHDAADIITRDDSDYVGAEEPPVDAYVCDCGVDGRGDALNSRVSRAGPVELAVSCVNHLKYIEGSIRPRAGQPPT